MELADTITKTIAQMVSYGIWAIFAAWAVGISIFVGIQLYRIIRGIFC